MEPGSSKGSTGMGNLTEMHIHSSAGANINTPGEQADNGLHSFIHSPNPDSHQDCALLKLIYLASDASFKVSIMQGDKKPY